MSGYRALRESAAWLDVSTRGKIRASGDDRQRFLHAMSTQPVESLQPGDGTYAFFLNAQGRIQADAQISIFADHVLLDTEPEASQALVEHLERFIIMDDVTLDNATAVLVTLVVEGPQAYEMASRAVGEPPAAAHAHRDLHGVAVLRCSLTGQPGIRLVTDAARREELCAALERAGAVAGRAEDFRRVRVENQVPRFHEDFFQTTIPHETQRLGAVSFTKGCYLGQEIVERVRSRGQVNRLLVGLEIEAERAPAAGSPVRVDDQEVGRLTSPVHSPERGRAFGFSLLRREAAGEGTAVQVDGLTGRVRRRGGGDGTGGRAEEPES